MSAARQHHGVIVTGHNGDIVLVLLTLGHTARYKLCYHVIAVALQTVAHASYEFQTAAKVNKQRQQLRQAYLARHDTLIH